MTFSDFKFFFSLQAQHAENLGVSSILCLPDLFFNPKTVDDLIHYLKFVSHAAPNTPLFYYHIPSFTGVNRKDNFSRIIYFQIET